MATEEEKEEVRRMVHGQSATTDDSDGSARLRGLKAIDTDGGRRRSRVDLRPIRDAAATATGES